MHDSKLIQLQTLVKMAEHFESKDSRDYADSVIDSSNFGNTLSSWDSTTGLLNETMLFHDQFEGICYRTRISESNITISFNSKVFFDMFKRKIHSDFLQSVDSDDTTFVSKCITHVKGAKCEIKLDSHLKTVELSGLGFKIWREERFPKISQALFKRLMDELDCQLDYSCSTEPLSDGIVETGFQHDEQKDCAYMINTESNSNPEQMNLESKPDRKSVV